MWELAKEYLENNENYSYGNVEVIECIEDGHKCDVRFKHNSSMYEDRTSLNMWDVMAYINSKK
tara:strand:- start:79 stop:267 length:189 start_codon:yes stop_codon:yes gene_type:complete